jgi:DNA-binding transcriptional ArsR family regulator
MGVTMRVGQAKKEILKILWEAGKPLKSREVAKQVRLSIPSSTMHLLGLRRAGYVSTPDKGYYAITNLGKEMIGMPRIDKERALDILRAVPLEKAFHFYTEIDQYTGVHANSLNDLCSKIQTIDIRSVEFHVARGDLEFWFRDLGDLELAKRMSLIREMSLSGEGLRKKVYETVKSRCEELASVSREPC